MQVIARREKLPDRRQGVTVRLCYRKGEADEIGFDATFNWQEGGRLREVFCELPFREGAQMRGLVDHACIVVSVALQRGATMAGLAATLVEDDLEQRAGSLLGLIIRTGMMIDAERGFMPEGEPPPTPEFLRGLA
jgi:hypothetical protein